MDSDALAARIGNLLSSSQAGGADNFPAKPPPPVPNHEILAPIGRGSYGEVWLARSVTGALRAVKVIWRSRFGSERPYDREFRGIVQFEPISRSHPGVVNILHVGRDDAAGCFFYVMELADNAEQVEKRESEKVGNESAAAISPARYSPRTLASDLKSRGRLPVTEAISLGVQLAGALGHLHRHGLVHRDVKPSNVIFVDGQPKLADIGLVASLNEDHSVVGTEGYIPPEGPGSERADLFSLGRLLYEAATGKNREEFPGLPDDLDRWPANERQGLIELNEVLARACASDAKKRHSNAADLAGDLNLILAGRSVRRAYRVERRLRQATLVSAVALGLVIAATFSNWLQHRQRELSEARAEREKVLRERAEAAERMTQQQLYTALLEQARATVLNGELGQRTRALEAVRRAAAISNSAALRGVAIAALALPDLRFERELPYGSGQYGAEFMVAMDPAFERVAYCRGSRAVEIRSAADDRLLATLPASTNLAVHVGKWSADGQFLAIKRDYPGGGTRADWEIWNVASTNRVLLLRDISYNALSFHPRLPQLMAAPRTGGAAIWNLENGGKLFQLPLTGVTRHLEFAADGGRFAAASPLREGVVLSVHDATSGAKIAAHVFTNFVSEFAWHPEGRWLAVPEHSSIVYRMDAQTGETSVIGRHKVQAVKAVFSPDGAYLFTGGWERELICWDTRALRRAFTISLNSYFFQISASGRRCAVLTETRVQLHAFERPALHREFAEDLGGGRNYAAFSPDGRWLAASGGERLVVWDLNNDGPRTSSGEGRNARLSFTQNGELFASRTGSAFRWRVLPGTNNAEPVFQKINFSRPAGFVSLCLVSNGVVLTGTNGSKLVGLDQLESNDGHWAKSIDGQNGASPDGRWLAMYRSLTADLYIHRLPDLECVARLTNQARISRFEFSPLGNELAVASQRGVEFWSTETWQRTRHLTNFTGIVYSPDARTFWLSTDYRTAGLHDARTAEPLLPLPVNALPLAISPDGRRLAVSVDQRRVQLWDLTEVWERLRGLGLDW